MTKTIAIFLGTLFIFNNIYSQKQSLETKYISGEKSRHCIKELYKFSFEGKWYSKYDSYDGSKKYGYSKISQTDYDKRGHYYEIRNDRFVLNEYGVNEYKKQDHSDNSSRYRRAKKLLDKCT